MEDAKEYILATNIKGAEVYILRSPFNGGIKLSDLG
jgi:hypothetical protein